MIIPRTSEPRIFNEGSFNIGGVKFGLVATPSHDPFFAMVYTTRKPKYAKKTTKTKLKFANNTPPFMKKKLTIFL